MPKTQRVMNSYGPDSCPPPKPCRKKLQTEETFINEDLYDSLTEDFSEMRGKIEKRLVQIISGEKQ